MAAEGMLVGGPLDGCRLAPKARGAWTWVAPNARGVLGYTDPGPSRVLYRSWKMDDAIELWLFAGHTHSLCVGCGGMNEVSDVTECHLCGGSLQRLSDRISS